MPEAREDVRALELEFQVVNISNRVIMKGELPS